MGAYDRIRVEGRTLNRRTNALYQQSKYVFGTLGGTGGIELLQGSYNKGGVAVSAGTHDGGGALDTKPTVETFRNWRLLRKAERMCMIASFDRPDLAGQWSHHNHGIVIGDREMSRSAARQVQDYYAGRNALASHALEADSIWRPQVLFNPIYPLKTVDLSNMVEQAKRTRGKTALPGVKYVQRALNVKFHANLAVDGIFGPATKKAYARWEVSIGGNGDGIPGHFSLVLLGAGRFNVKA